MDTELLCTAYELLPHAKRVRLLWMLTRFAKLPCMQITANGPLCRHCDAQAIAIVRRFVLHELEDSGGDPPLASEEERAEGAAAFGKLTR